MENLKICSKCQKTKHWSEFYMGNNRPRNPCKLCKSAYYQKNKIEIRAQQKQYYDANQQQILAQKRSYYEQNKESIMARIKIRFQNDPSIQLFSYIRRRTRHFLKVGVTYNNIVKCSHDKLVKWFEFNFNIDSHWEMTFANFGEIWHIDHVYPLSKVNLDDPKKDKYFSWQNLRPTLKSYNMTKGNKIKKMDLILLELRMKIFLKTYKQPEKRSLLDVVLIEKDDPEFDKLEKNIIKQEEL